MCLRNCKVIVEVPIPLLPQVCPGIPLFFFSRFFRHTVISEPRQHLNCVNQLRHFSHPVTYITGIFFPEDSLLCFWIVTVLMNVASECKIVVVIRSELSWSFGWYAWQVCTSKRLIPLLSKYLYYLESYGMPIFLCCGACNCVFYLI